MSDRVEQTAVVLAGGGERVVAWQVGVLAGLADAGMDAARAARVVGTSAGSAVAARLLAGEDMRATADRLAAGQAGAVDPPADSAFERLARVYEEAGTEPEGRRRIGALALSAAPGRIDPLLSGLGGWRPPDDWPPELRIVAVDAHRGERVVLGPSMRVSAAVGIAASRALPVLKRPVQLRSRKLIDGAIGSATNADVAIENAPEVDRVVVIAALPHDGDHPTLARVWNDALRRDLLELDIAGVEVCLIRATAADLDAMGPDPMSDARAPLAVAAGREAGRLVAPALGAPADLPLAMAA